MKRSDQHADIREIADAICSDTATAEQMQTLEHLLAGNPDAQRFYAEYMGIHAYLTQPKDIDTTLVYRRITEELIVNPQTAPNAPAQVIAMPTKAHPHKRLLLILAITVAIAIVGMALFNTDQSPESVQLRSGQLSIDGQGSIINNTVALGEYEAKQDTVLAFPGGDELSLTRGSIIKLFNSQELSLKQGALMVAGQSSNNLRIHGSQFTLNTQGDSVRVDVTQAQPLVKGQGRAVLSPARWRPQHFWNFEGKADSVIDSANSAHGVIHSGATRVKGLVGSGAFHFDGGDKAAIMVGTGGGTAPATGTFSVIDGVTIEALVHTNYNGEPKNYDEIFRKDRGDAPMRMLLSFQNHSPRRYNMPEGDYGVSLSFGLFIVGQDYQELKLELDGKDGRPTLEQLRSKPHHIAATYSVASGLKAIYINGELKAAYQYPPGSKMLSGGPGSATIGNHPVIRKWHKEAFDGVIDELAFYNFALPNYTINQHFENTQKGNNYFGLRPTENDLPSQHNVLLPADELIALDALTGLPAIRLN